MVRQLRLDVHVVALFVAIGLAGFWSSRPAAAWQDFDGSADLNQQHYRSNPQSGRTHPAYQDEDAWRDEPISMHTYSGTPDGVMVVPAAPMYPLVIPAPIGSAPLVPAPAGVRYFCNNPRGYYPYVWTCRSAWRQVSAQPVR